MALVGGSQTIRQQLEQELSSLIDEERSLDEELREFFEVLAAGDHRNNGLSKSSGVSASASDLTSSLIGSIKKIEQFAPSYEVMVQDSKKLVAQVEDCRNVSDRMSAIVRRLDTMQIRAQQALACTEDIINLKDCKVRMLTAMEEKNLQLAVNIVRQVQDIDVEAAKTSDDFAAIKQAERELRGMVQEEFNKAMEDSNINLVMSLCPLLQTLGLETEARDSFMDFVEKAVFIAVSADAASIEGTTDPATGYAQSLSSVFNSAYLILQQYLPMVIQGMESSLGDVHFIRRLHAKCEQESGQLLKRYMKFRNIKDIIGSVKSTQSTPNPKQQSQTPAKMHVVLDELALLIQYCCLYSKYIKQLCVGAETRKRASILPSSPTTSSSSSSSSSPVTSTSSSSSSATSSTVAVTVFPGPTEFDKMVDELINRYYMEGENWLMRMGVKGALVTPVGDGDYGSGLDECFFVLQRCGQRAIATNNIHAACAVLHLVSDLLSSDLQTKATELLNAAATRVGATLQEHMSRYTKGSGGGGDDQAGGLSKGLKSLGSLATSLSMTSAGSGKGLGGGEEDDGSDDAWGIASSMQAFNVIETCARYTERLGKDINNASLTVFGSSSTNEGSSGNSTTQPPHASQSKRGASGTGSGSTSSQSSEIEKLKLCREDFDAAKIAFMQALRQGVDKIVSIAAKLMKEVLVYTFSKNGPLGGVKFDAPDDRFDMQPALGLIPRILVAPFEAIINICTTNLTESNKDLMIGLLADACCERLEHYISQVREQCRVESTIL